MLVRTVSQEVNKTTSAKLVIDNSLQPMTQLLAIEMSWSRKVSKCRSMVWDFEASDGWKAFIKLRSLLGSSAVSSYPLLMTPIKLLKWESGMNEKPGVGSKRPDRVTDSRWPLQLGLIGSVLGDPSVTGFAFRDNRCHLAILFLCHPDRFACWFLSHCRNCLTELFSPTGVCVSCLGKRSSRNRVISLA